MDATPLIPVKGIFKLSLGKAIFLKDGKLFKEWTYYDLPLFTGKTLLIAGGTGSFGNAVLEWKDF